jgi:hypothetical protein
MMEGNENGQEFNFGIGFSKSRLARIIPQETFWDSIKWHPASVELLA